MRRQGEDVASQIRLRGGDGDSVVAALENELTQYFGHPVTVERKRRSDGPKRGNAASHFCFVKVHDRTYHVYWTQQYAADWDENFPMRIRWQSDGSFNTAYQKMVLGDRGDLYATIWVDKPSSRVVAINVVDLTALRKLQVLLGANRGRVVDGMLVDEIISRIIPTMGSKMAEIDVQRLEIRYGVKLSVVASHRASLGLLDFILR